MSILVFANGDMDSTGWVTPYLQRATVVIAANGGVRHVLALGRTPDVLIGDLDSLGQGVRERLIEQSTTILPYDAEKDETDLELALLYAVATYEEEILILGGLGGRVDQMIANILLLMHPKLRGRSISFQTQYQRILLIDGEATIEGQTGDMLSLIPLGGDVHVTHTEGLRWAVHDDILAFGPARGVSNEMMEETARVRVHRGHLLCIHTRRVWQR